MQIYMNMDIKSMDGAAPIRKNVKIGPSFISAANDVVFIESFLQLFFEGKWLQNRL